MILAAIVQVSVCFLILRWLLKKKPGEPYSKKTVKKFVLFGALGVVLWYCCSLALPLEEDTFFGMNPILSGFLTALITAALIEEIVKYIVFRLAIRNNQEVVRWLDVIIAAIAVGVGFTLLEDVTYLFDGAGTIIRAILPGHLLFQGLMGYYYGKARITKQFKYHVLSLAVPIIVHTLFDMFIIGLMSIVGNTEALTGITEEQLMSLPYYSYIIPMLVCAVAVIICTLIALILFFRKIAVWSRKGEKQELLKGQQSI
ncbi:MAG: PrsW family intramembrane metalloprotease [Oscillospiraceae bacterium]|nr:PrsW family intramembrane metalloprotease [Oscillospiraceae bacterium]